jgi:hypothetical protein
VPTPKAPTKSGEVEIKTTVAPAAPIGRPDLHSSVRGINDKVVSILKKFDVKQIAANEPHDTLEALMGKLERNVTALEAVFKNLRVEAK